MIVDEVRQELLRRSIEQLVDEAAEHGAARILLRDLRDVAVCLAFDLVSNEALRLEFAEDGQDGGVREVCGKFLPHFGHCSVAQLPEDRHDVKLAVTK